MRYMLHFFDVHEHLRRSEAVVCEDDQIAIALAVQRPHPHVVELWCGDRRVLRFEPRPMVEAA